MKYIIYQNKKYGVETAILLSEFEKHKDVALAMGIDAPIAAGFIKTDADGQLRIGGDSFTLKVKSRPVEDWEIIKRELKGLL